MADTTECTLTDVLGGAKPGEMSLSNIIVQLAPNLFLAPSDLELAVTELGLFSRMGREAVLKRTLQSVREHFDLVMIDCPPSLGLLTINALTSADAVLIPTQPQAIDLRGLRLFLTTLENIRQELNPNLNILGILVTFFDRRLVHHRNALTAVEHASLPIFKTKIGRSVRVAEAATSGETIITFDSDNAQAKAYGRLAKEVEQWLDAERPPMR